jgi:ferritin-like metal-binding protein YciE
MPEMNSLRELLADQIKDLYSMEKQLTKAIPKMAKGSNEEELKTALTNHLEETQGQVERLDQIAEMLGVRTSGKKCLGMEGLVNEGSEVLGEDGDESICDLAIIGAADRVEHYEIAAYMSAISLAQKMGKDDVVSLFQESLAEEQAADEKLRSIAETLLESAPAGEDEGGEEMEEEEADSEPVRKKATKAGARGRASAGRG